LLEDPLAQVTGEEEAMGSAPAECREESELLDAYVLGFITTA